MNLFSNAIKFTLAGGCVNLTVQTDAEGLGLPLAKRYIEAMGGTFRIDSAAGEGTRITLDLPAANSTDALKGSNDLGEVSGSL